MVVAATTGDAETTVSASRDSSPDAVILSDRIPGNIVQIVGAIGLASPGTEILVLADDADDDELMLELVVAGARGFLLGETDPARLPHAVAGLIAGEAAFPRRLVRVLADEVARRRRPPVPRPDGPGLTARETEVLEALATGRATAEVARRLGMREATVRTHAANATRKLGVPGRAEALEWIRTRSTRGAR